MDPITDGNIIFQNILKELSNKKVTRSIEDLEILLNGLKVDAKGKIILDFMDSGNWDMIAGFNIDKKSNTVQIHWHDFRGKNNEDDMVRLVFPAELYSLFFHFQSIKIIESSSFPAFLIQGYALSDKEVRKYLSTDAEEFELEDKNNFSKNAYRKINGRWQAIKVLNTPIHSMLILPKNSGLDVSHSKEILFAFNLDECLKRLEAIKEEVENIDDSDVDQICEKANTLRRIFENSLKIELCYRNITMNKGYSQLLLGDLIAKVKSFYDDKFQVIFSKMVSLSNELSHDSGKPINRAKVYLLYAMVLLYIEFLKSTIKLYPHGH
ncbi:hypothetical protein [Paenibacillus rhizophilus]|uniref:Uncharacterized protein n=1 Tax=Paenibacillus rhizophilus TaxID=1850366 RepID=A0A3N9PBT4_9BACL|nr:hypothetical protein [Paenibacillus rhizophilus]RQW13339.1 hypothetical protein EH198_02595 [Paenibacillus rhizophilus]